MFRSPRLLLCAVLAFAGCDGDGPLSINEVRAIQAARARWLASSVRQAYTFEVRQSCFCALEYVQWNTVTVRNDTVVDVKPTEASGVVLPRAFWPNVVTVEGMFASLRFAEGDFVDDVRAQFDPQYGYPVLVEVVASPQIADGGGAIYARNLRPASGIP